MGRKMIVRLVYVNPEGLRETKRILEVLQVDAVKYEEKGCYCDARVGLGAEEHLMGRGCWS